MYIGLHVKYPPFFFVRFKETRIFSTDFRKIFIYQISWKSVQWERNSNFIYRFSKNFHISNFMKIRPVGAKLEFSLQIFEKSTYIEFHENPSSGSETRIFSTNFRKILMYQISWKSVQWEPRCSMRTERWTDMTKLIVAFRNFAKSALKKSKSLY
jgi:hypothetical protein